jgi:hypothetical protein
MATQTATQEKLPNGLAAAALLAGGIGSFAVGLMTTLSEAVASLGPVLTFVKPVGPLSGKTTVAVIIWLIAWVALGWIWKDKDVDFGKVSLWAFILLGLGLLGTFPPFFELFAAE